MNTLQSLYERFGGNREITQIDINDKVDTNSLNHAEFQSLLQYIFMSVGQKSSALRYMDFDWFINKRYWNSFEKDHKPSYFQTDWRAIYEEYSYPLVTKEGKILKRIREILRSAWEIKVDNATMGEWGNKLKEILSLRYPFYVGFESDIIGNEWKAGDFGDSGSCYFDVDGYQYARYAIAEQADAGAILFFDPNHKGEGRAWIMNHPSRDKAIVMFNVYPRAGNQYCYNTCGAVMAKMLEMVYNEPFDFVKTDIASNGILYVNNGCLIIYPKNSEYHSWDYPVNYHFEMPDYYGQEDAYICDSCGDGMSEGEAYASNDGGIYCESCYHEIFTSCEHCNREISIDDAMYDNDGYAYCSRCFDRYFRYCEKCGNDVRKEDYNNDTECCDNCTDYYFTYCEQCKAYHTNEDYEVCKEEHEESEMIINE